MIMSRWLNKEKREHDLHRTSNTDETGVKDSGGSRREYDIIVASDRRRREQAYRLAYRVYRDSNLVQFDPSGMVVSHYDAQAETFTLLVENSDGEPVATVSLVLDSSQGLPCDEIYEEELDDLRNWGHRLVEVTRLAVDAKYKNSKMPLVQMFSHISLFARRYWKATDFVIEVNPHHAEYYRRMLLFEQLGDERCCPRVADAPAVLMRLDLILQEEEIGLVGGTRERGRSFRDRNLYSYFNSLEEENLIVKPLARQFKPMTSQDAEYFGLLAKERSFSTAIPALL